MMNMADKDDNDDHYATVFSFFDIHLDIQGQAEVQALMGHIHT